MKLYSALIKKNKEGKIQDVKLLSEGFSWTAFFFSVFWFLYHKMWKEFFALVIVSITFAVLESVGYFYGFAKIFTEVLLAIVIALNANHWFVESLKKRGFEFVGLVFGKNKADAQMRFIKNLEVDYGLEALKFDDSIVNPKLYRKVIKMKKNNQNFAT